jgi:hypothetical protein
VFYHVTGFQDRSITTLPSLRKSGARGRILTDSLSFRKTPRCNLRHASLKKWCSRQDSHLHKFRLEGGRLMYSSHGSVVTAMDAADIVSALVEDHENPKDFVDQNEVFVPSNRPTHRYNFNIGEGDYRCGIAFDIDAGSRREAVALANQLLRKFFWTAPSRMGAFDLDSGSENNMRVYVDDDIEATEQDIVDEYPLENT